MNYVFYSRTTEENTFDRRIDLVSFMEDEF